ncbi:MAG: site-2 protease family protein, partial [Terriglobales bacterium]
MSQTALIKDIFEFVLLLFSLCVHESAHAWTASLLGDHTARLEGRITLNPTYHIDPVGTLFVPALIIFGPLFGFSFFSGFIIGWAKPTPVITRNFRKIIRDENLVTLAGPASNLLLVLIAFAILAGLAIFLPNGQHVVMNSFLASVGVHVSAVPQPVALLCSLAILINLSLFFFNLLPIPPLDGSHIVRNMLPYGAVQVYDRIGGGWL